MTQQNLALGKKAPLTLSSLSPDEVEVVAKSPDELKYGTVPQQALTAAEAFGRGGSLGTSDVLENYLEQVNPDLFGKEARKKRMEVNPVTSTIGNMAGGAALIAGTGGLAAPAEAAMGTGLAARVLGTAAEGGLFGAGGALSDAALGDPNLNAQKVLSDVGFGAALGGGLGVLSKGLEAVPALLRGAKAKAVVPEGAIAPVVDVPGGVGKKPTSLQEMEERVAQAKKFGGQTDINELPQKAEAQEAVSRIGPLMEFPVTDMQLGSLDSQDLRNEFKTLVEVPGKNGEILRNYQGAQKKELSNMLENTINKIAPDYVPTTDAQEAGERAAELFTKQIQSTRDALGPAFEKIKASPLEDTNHLPGVIDYLTNEKATPYANPKLANMFDTSGDALKIKPYKTNMGIDKATYNAVSQAVEALEENPKNFQNLIDIRKGLSQHVDVTKLGDAAKEVAGAKAAMMDYIQDAVQKTAPEMQVREVFKKWAQNEQAAQMIEKKFGAEIGSGNFRSLAKGKADEAILKKIFTDSETVNAVRQILPDQDFKKMLSDYLAIAKNDVTDKGVFSSNKFASYLKRHQYALNEAFKDDATSLTKMKDALTLLRIFADDTPINPSGTAKTLIQSLLSGGIDPFEHMKNLGEYAKTQLAELKTAREINKKLGAQQEDNSKLSMLQNMMKKVNTRIEEGAKGIYEGGAGRGAALSLGTHLSEKEYDKLVKRINEVSSNPQLMIDHLGSATASLHNAAPNITQGVHTSMVSGVAFLNSKMPRPPTELPLSHQWTPSINQRAQFQQYYAAVNDPVSALKQVKAGRLTNETMEALQAVHPQLLSEMRSQVIRHMDLERAKKLPYAQKLSLAKFLGQPLDSSMTPQAIQSNQQSLMNPSLSNQTTQAAQRKSTLGGLKQLDLASRARVGDRQE